MNELVNDKSQTKFEAAESVILDVISAGRDNPEFGLLTFDGCDVAVRQRFTRDRRSFSLSVNSSIAQGQAPVARALRSARGMADLAASDRVTVILLSGGVETCGGNPIQEARKFRSPAVNSRSKANLIGRGGFYPASQYLARTINLKVVGFGLSQSEKSYLQKIATAAEGEYFDALNVKDLFRQTIDEEANQPTTVIIALTFFGLTIFLVAIAYKTSAKKIPRLIVAGGASYELRKGRVTIGSAIDNNITIEDRLVSRRHASISVEGQECVIDDVGSKNGVFVNGQKIIRCELRNGDAVRLGNTVLRIVV
jgi:preprotein translocase subunit SecG